MVGARLEPATSGSSVVCVTVSADCRLGYEMGRIKFKVNRRLVQISMTMVTTLDHGHG
jgi:hypothetical protein